LPRGGRGASGSGTRVRKLHLSLVLAVEQVTTNSRAGSAEIRVRQHLDFARAMSESGRRRNVCVEHLIFSQDGKILEILLRSLRVCTSEPQTIRRIPGAVHRRFGCRRSSRLGAAGFPPECAGSLATLSLAAMRGLQLDCSLPASEPASTRHSGRCWDC
jgi:hypothetical protein